jgi:ParB family chromosome partitioning protein
MEVKMSSKKEQVNYKEVATDSIKVISNPRKDFGDLDELTRSIKENGILEPLLINKKNELISGERRLKAAKTLNLKNVPVLILERDPENEDEIKLVENIQRKNINPIEEGDSFQKYLAKYKVKAEKLGIKLGKTESYVNRRIEAASTIPEARKALIDGKIQLGHAIVLAHISEKDQKTALKKIIEEEIPVERVSYALDNKIGLKEAPFDQKNCKACKYNGSEQTLLVDTESGLEGMCLNPACFQKKVAEWVTEETEMLIVKGIKVLTPTQIKGIKTAKRIDSWDKKEYETALAKLEDNPEMYAVVFEELPEQKFPTKQLYRLKATEKSGKAEAIEEAEIKLNLNSKEKLRKKLDIWNHDFLIVKCQEKLEADLDIKKVAVWLLSQYSGEVPEGNLQQRSDKLFAMDKKQTDARLLELAKGVFDEMDEFALKAASKMVEVDYEKDFVMSEEFLELFSKEQLIDLIKESKLDTDSDHYKELKSKPDYVKYVLANWKKGMVPKMLVK